MNSKKKTPGNRCSFSIAYALSNCQKGPLSLYSTSAHLMTPVQSTVLDDQSGAIWNTYHKIMTCNHMQLQCAVCAMCSQPIRALVHIFVYRKENNQFCYSI